jgi:hypothetical protein
MTLDQCQTLFSGYNAGWQRILDTSEVGDRIRIAGSKHDSFSDVPFLAPLVSALPNNPEILPSRVWSIASQLTLAFFDRHLRGVDAPLPDFTEATVEITDHR